MQEPITISILTNRIKSILENEFNFVYVTGEISNFKKHPPSGHYYFVLKDESSQISVTMWRAVNEQLLFTPEDGMKVVMKGRIRLYATRGTYNIEAFEMIPVGQGELQLAFEKLKMKLYEEGLFDEENKKPIPKFPENVGIITSESGAVIQDFTKIMSRRYTAAKLKLFPVNVQGLFAADEIIRSIKIANDPKFGLDVIVIARGGGSLEDLWTFNEESVARAVFNSRVPIVSAIGHEVDYTICDFVADLRAPTPSAAAEMIFPDSRELLERINRFEYYIGSFTERIINNYYTSIDDIEKSYVFRRPEDLINEFNYNLDLYEKNLRKTVNEKLLSCKNSLRGFERYINGINPNLSLQRGYSIVRKKNQIINKSKLLNPGDEIDIEFSDNSVKSKII